MLRRVLYMVKMELIMVVNYQIKHLITILMSGEFEEEGNLLISLIGFSFSLGIAGTGIQ